MPNNTTDPLFQLINSLSKSEKRNFKLFVQRNSANEELKIVQLFDAIDKSEHFDEKQILDKNKAINKTQLPNLKAHLYKQILASLRVLSDEQNIEITLNDMMNNARILYNKGLYLQSLKIIDKLKEVANHHFQLTYLQQALFFEKKIESLYITRSLKNRAEELRNESVDVEKIIHNVTQLSNLSLELYAWYIKNGFAHDDYEARAVNDFLNENLPKYSHNLQSFYEKLYLFQSFCWKAFIVQDFLLHYRYSQKWVHLFDSYPQMAALESIHYIKGMHNLMSAYFYIGDSEKLKKALQKFDELQKSKVVLQSQNNAIQCFIYHTISLLNYYFINGTYDEGLLEIPRIEAQLKEFDNFIDKHRVLVIDYKIACMYFGAGNYDVAIDYLNKIINSKAELRTDLQCYARLLHLIAHYEIGNLSLLDYLAKSVYRFMGKMQNLSVVEEELFLFLRKSLSKNNRQLNVAFQQLLDKLNSIQNKPFETRALMYLDVTSWLESKIRKVPVQEIVKEKYSRKNAG